VEGFGGFVPQAGPVFLGLNLDFYKGTSLTFDRARRYSVTHQAISPGKIASAIGSANT